MKTKMTYTYMPAWIYADKNLTVFSKFLLEQLVPLSQNGKKVIRIVRKEYADMLHVSARTMTRTIKQLLDRGFIERTSAPDQGDPYCYFIVTSKALSPKEV